MVLRGDRSSQRASVAAEALLQPHIIQNSPCYMTVHCSLYRVEEKKPKFTCREAACADTWICAFEFMAGLILWAFSVHGAFGFAIWRRSNVLVVARAYSDTAHLVAFAVRSAW